MRLSVTISNELSGLRADVDLDFEPRATTREERVIEIADMTHILGELLHQRVQPIVNLDAVGKLKTDLLALVNATEVRCSRQADLLASQQRSVDHWCSEATKQLEAHSTALSQRSKASSAQVAAILDYAGQLAKLKNSNESQVLALDRLIEQLDGLRNRVDELSKKQSQTARKPCPKSVVAKRKAASTSRRG